METNKKSKSPGQGSDEGFNVEKAIEQDLRSSCALLHVVLDHPKLLKEVVKVIKGEMVEFQAKRAKAEKAGVPNP